MIYVLSIRYAQAGYDYLFQHQEEPLRAGVTLTRGSMGIPGTPLDGNQSLPAQRRRRRPGDGNYS